jgi:putative ABC transport system permease protein
MILGSILKIAFDALRVNKLRAGLTLLGVIIGVTSVMTIVSALQGMQDAIVADLSQFGPNTFIIARIGMAMSEEEFHEKIKRKPFDLKSVELIEKGCPLVDKISPRANTQEKVKYKDQALRNVLISGMTSAAYDIIDSKLTLGRYPTADDDRARRTVAYIGDKIREEFFEGLDPIGKEITIAGTKYTVIGVAEKSASPFGNDQGSYVFIPMSTFTAQFGTPRRGLMFAVKAVSVEELPNAMDQVRMVLRAQRQVPFDKPDDFDMLTADNILDVINSFTRILRLSLIGISSISLVVGGIVVMNIMMVSVTERTREIGIRKSLGARQKHILLQFLFESLLVTMSGGIIGIVIGFILAKMLMGWIDMDISPSMSAILMGIGISSGVGLFFGIYPAMKAARLDPVKALSYE